MLIWGVRTEEAQGQQPELGRTGRFLTQVMLRRTLKSAMDWSVSNKQMLSLIILITDLIYFIPGVAR